MKRRLHLAAGLLLAVASVRAQNYTPIPLTGYNHDAIAEAWPNPQALTDTVLDGSNYVMYSQAFASGGSFAGGLPNNGAINDPSGTRQFQLAPFTTNNVLNVMRNASRTFTLTTPASYRRLTVLALSTEGASSVNVTLQFTDGTTTTVVSGHTIPDWFSTTPNLVLAGYGRVTRNPSVTAINGAPSNPAMFYIDIDVNCADRKKLVQSIRFDNVTTAGSNAPFPNAVFLAVSGQQSAQVINVTTTPASCGSANGGATVSASGEAAPYTYSWNTTPVQTGATINNIAAGNYQVTVTDALGCATVRPVTITQLPSPTSITATATPASVCAGGSVQLSVAAVGAGLSTYSWLPGGGNTATATVVPTVTTTYTVLGNDAAGCPYSRQVTVIVNQRPPEPVVPNISVCQGSQAVISVQSPQSTYTYSWYTAASGGSPIATGPQYTMPVAGAATFYVEAVSNGCSSSARTPVTVNFLPSPAVNAGNDLTIVEGDVVTLGGTATAGTYSWTPSAGMSNTTILNPTVKPAATTSYTLSVTNAQGCTRTDDVTITVLPYCVKPMEAFSPNGDGINDLWTIADGVCLASADVKVFNRYGSIVYQNTDYRNNWNGTYDGRPIPDGTYYFIINYKLVNGKAAYKKGNLTILR